MSVFILAHPYAADDPERNVRQLVAMLRNKEHYRRGDTVLLPVQALNGLPDHFWSMRPENRDRNLHWLKKLALGLKNTPVRLLIPAALHEGVGVFEIFEGALRSLPYHADVGALTVDSDSAQLPFDVVFRTAAVGEAFAELSGSDYVIVDGQAFDNGRIYLGQCRFVRRSRTRASYMAHSEPIDLEQGHACLQDEYHVWYAAMKLALRLYMKGNGFKRVTLGLSGGLDSAVVAAVAVDALGAENVNAFILPSCFTSEQSRQDASQLGARLGLKLREIDIMPSVNAAREAVKPHLPYWADPGLMNENIQARVRGLLLMSYSNADGSLVLNTGNKSELAVGYCTLYGDMVGGLALLADIYKSDLYRLCRAVDFLKENIPASILAKAPSAELRENQKDEDSLPSYPVLDAVLKDLIEGHMDGKRLRKKYGSDLAVRVCKLVMRSQFKHRQAPLGLILTSTPVSALRPDFFHGMLPKQF